MQPLGTIPAESPHLRLRYEPMCARSGVGTSNAHAVASGSSKHKAGIATPPVGANHGGWSRSIRRFFVHLQNAAGHCISAMVPVAACRSVLSCNMASKPVQCLCASPGKGMTPWPNEILTNGGPLFAAEGEESAERAAFERNSALDTFARVERGPMCGATPDTPCRLRRSTADSTSGPERRTNARPTAARRSRRRARRAPFRWTGRRATVRVRRSHRDRAR